MDNSTRSIQKSSSHHQDSSQENGQTSPEIDSFFATLNGTETADATASNPVAIEITIAEENEPSTDDEPAATEIDSLFAMLNGTEPAESVESDAATSDTTFADEDEPATDEEPASSERDWLSELLSGTESAETADGDTAASDSAIAEENEPAADEEPAATIKLHSDAAEKVVFEVKSIGKSTSAVVSVFLGDDFLTQDKIDIAKSAARTKFVAALCEKYPGIDAAAAERQLEVKAGLLSCRRGDRSEESSEPTSEELLEEMPESALAEAREMLESPDLVSRIVHDVGRLGVAGEHCLIVTIFLVGVSRLLLQPLAAIIQAASSTGKSFVLFRVTKLFPPEAVIHATGLTPQALFYLERGALRHKFVVGGERSRREDDETAENTKALREMISSGELNKLVTMKSTGGLVTQTIHQEGPIAYAETTTQTSIFGEDANRCLLLGADERREQTQAVIRCLAAGYSNPVRENVDAIIQRHHAAQRMLQQLDVVVPFAELIGEHFNADRVEARRGFPHLVRMIQASAVLHQFQRERDVDGNIIATANDYQIAWQLCRGPLARLLGGMVSNAALRFHQRMQSWPTGQFTTTEAARREDKSLQGVRDLLRELAEVGAVEQTEPSRGSKPATWRLTSLDPREVAAGFALPPVEIVFP